MAKNSPYSEEEKKLLIEIFEHNSKKFILDAFAKFHRSGQSIFRTAKKMGLKRSPELIGQDIAKGSFHHENNWTDNEFNIIKEFYPHSLQEFIESKLPGRTWKAIKLKARKLGVIREKKFVEKDRQLKLMKNGDIWTPEEDELLKHIYPNNTREFILEKIHKPWKAICRRARRLNLHRNPQLINADKLKRGPRKDSCSKEEEKLLREIYFNNTKKFIMEKFIPFGRSWQSIRRFAKQLGLKRNPAIIEQERIEAGKYGSLARKDTWNSNEDKILMEFYAISSQNKIENLLSERTFRSIRERALFLGLSRNKEIVDRDRALHLKENFGVTSTWELEKVKEASRKTQYKYGTQRCSRQQEYIAKLVKGEINFPVGGCNVDILLENNIVCEYNGGGHYILEKTKKLSHEEFINKERKRDFFLKLKGYLIIKIISKKDMLPEDGILLKMIEEGKNYLKSGHSWIEFNIDSKQVRCSKYLSNYDFGTLRKIEKKSNE